MTLVGEKVGRREAKNGQPVHLFHIKKKLDNGAFGNVYLAESLNGQKPEVVAIKVEGEPDVEKPRFYTDTEPPFEWEVYQTVNGLEGFPHVYYCGFEGRLSIMVMDLLGMSLRDVVVKAGGRVTPEVAACVGYQSLSILERLHDVGYIHGDVKPDNIVAGIGDNANKLFFVDLGLAAPWRPPFEQPFPYTQRLGRFNGTRRYSSVHAHLGRGPSRRDDIESLAYVLIFLIRGKLPWQGLGEGDDARDEVGRLKRLLPSDELCKGFPVEFRDFLEYARNIKFDDHPDYDLCRKILYPLTRNEGFGFVFNEKLCQTMLVEDSPLVQGKKRSGGYGLSDGHFLAKRRKVLPFVPGILRPFEPDNWILVFSSTNSPYRQWYTKNASYEGMKDFIKSKWDEGGSVSQVSLAFDHWSAIVTSGRTLTESMKVSTRFLPTEWIEKKWTEGFFITIIAGRAGNSVVVMSKGTSFYRQDFIVSNSFPIRWVNTKWREGYYITSIATGDSQWAVVMSKGTSYVSQKLEIDYKYPSEGIRTLWKQGYRISAIGATNELMVFVMSFNPRNTENQEQTHRTPRAPRESIEAAWSQNLYVTVLTSGKS